MSEESKLFYFKKTPRRPMKKLNAECWIRTFVCDLYLVCARFRRPDIETYIYEYLNRSPDIIWKGVCTFLGDGYESARRVGTKNTHTPKPERMGLIAVAVGATRLASDVLENRGLWTFFGKGGVHCFKIVYGRSSSNQNGCGEILWKAHLKPEWREIQNVRLFDGYGTCLYKT